jgi:hypothetical protein
LRHRLLKYLKRLLVVGLVLGIIAVAGFTWFCYWPLEGSVDEILTLVPEEVEFVVRADYDEMERTGWVQENVLDDPLHPLLADDARARIDDAKRQIEDLERQINENIPVPFEWARFGVEKDVLPGEFVMAGNFCREFGPDRGPPSWQEILVLKRVSWRTRCVAALKHDFIRQNLGPNLVVEPEGDEIYQLTFRNIRPKPRKLREGCGNGFVVPPDNEWYLRRCKDVIAISNSLPLIRKVAAQAESGTAQGSFAARPGFDLELRDSRVVAAVNMEPLKSYFMKVFQRWPELLPIRRFFDPQARVKVNGHLSFASTDLLSAGADISYVQAHAEDISRAVYSLAERSVREGIANLVPADDTFAMLSLRVDPNYLLKGVVADALTKEQRDQWEENVRNEGEFSSVDEFFDDISTRVGNEATIAVGRLGRVFDEIGYADDFFSGDPDPMPLLAIMVKLKENANQEELQAYLTTKVPLLGVSKELTSVEYRGYTYSRAVLALKTLDYKFVSPCFILANDHLIFTNNEQYMQRILDIAADRNEGSLARDRTFQVTMGSLPERGHVGLFVDVEKLFRVPQTAQGAPGPGNAGFWWDRRNQIDIRNEYPARLTPEQDKAKEKRIEEHIKDYEARFPEYFEIYRREIEGMRRFRGIGLVLGANRDTISARLAAVFRQAEPWLRWRR